MGKLGLLGILVPERWGGIEMSTVGFVATMEQIGLADQSVAAAVGGGDHVGGPQRPAGPDGRCLLDDGRVHEAGHQTVAIEGGHPLLKPRMRTIRRCISRGAPRRYPLVLYRPG
jgi:hypothetical protein